MKYSYFALILILLSFFGSHISQGAIPTFDIEAVIEKSVLDSSDFEIIDNFVYRSIAELLSTTDFTSVANIRSTILRYSNSNKDSAQEQYSNAFYDSVYRHVGAALSKIESVDSAKVRENILINLLILLDELDNWRLTEYAVRYLNSENTVVRYWALHNVTNNSIIEQMNSDAEGLLLAKDIAKHILQQAEQAEANEQSLMLKFASEITLKDGDDIILRIADVRMDRYKNWEVEYELLDAMLLRLLKNEIANSNPEKQKAFGRRFCTLFSYVFQRFIKGIDILSEEHLRNLASALVDVERNCVSSILGQVQITIKQAIESDNLAGLLEEHNRLLGDRTKAGELPKRLNCDYGSNPDGSSRMYPPVLPDAP